MSDESDDYRARIERVYMVLERQDNERGALAWFARKARVGPVTVSRWLTDGKEARPFNGTAEGLLEALEALADVEETLARLTGR